jgi:hypothetical protein
MGLTSDGGYPLAAEIAERDIDIDGHPNQPNYDRTSLSDGISGDLLSEVPAGTLKTLVSTDRSLGSFIIRG